MSSTQDEQLEKEYLENCEIIKYLLERNEEIARVLSGGKYASDELIFWSQALVDTGS